MAMAKPVANPRRGGRTRNLLMGLALLAGVLVFAFWPRVSGYAKAGASVGARVSCACRFVAGRSLSDCRKDFEPGMWAVILSESDEPKAVTATVPLLSRQTATFREGEGCVLEPWDG